LRLKIYFEIQQVTERAFFDMESSFFALILHTVSSYPPKFVVDH